VFINQDMIEILFGNKQTDESRMVLSDHQMITPKYEQGISKLLTQPGAIISPYIWNNYKNVTNELIKEGISFDGDDESNNKIVVKRLNMKVCNYIGSSQA